MSAKLEKLNDKSLLFLVWKQRKVINALIGKLKTVLADKAQYVPLSEYMQLQSHYENLKFICEKQKAEIERLRERSVRDEK